MTKDVHEGNSLQEAHDILPVSVQPAQQSGCLITGDCRKYILTIFFHREILTPQPGKALPCQIKEVCQGAGKSQAAVLDFP